MGFNLGPEKILVVLVFALIFLGPDKLPEAARKLGEWMGHLRRMSGGFETELRQALDEPLKTFQREFSIGEQHTGAAAAPAVSSGAAADPPRDAEPTDPDPTGDSTHDSSDKSATERLPAPSPPDAPPVSMPTADSAPVVSPPALPAESAHAPTQADSDPLPDWVFPGSSSTSRPGFH